jgi:hypothetical protein
MDHEVHKKTAEVFKADKIFKYVSDGYDPERYRMHVDVSDKQQNCTLKGLIDTGANTEVLSYDACKKLGIVDQITETGDAAYGVGGKLNVLGNVSTTIYVGDIGYTASFQVIDHISGFDIMIGTRFLNRTDVMHKIHRVVSDVVGAQHVSQGN